MTVLYARPIYSEIRSVKLMREYGTAFGKTAAFLTTISLKIVF